ncbi:DUF3019 domain-containing protein [Alkalimonas collagenimarina]|uniref:DUF3019 domain-containing protein n=1 Tax=Alkalimonas collagenimarina TaxID=400390 RepID=A0ABT9GYD3_9GAMM|nr:DUF3019 domain-containing protein [Alkalimonas collagenimarina]MDP4536052.1 DUF3019 domain-containing protein [Alkalimonas collagenimarina]
MNGFDSKVTLLLALLWTGGVAAEECSTDLCWSAMPVVCISSEQGGGCEAELAIAWSSPEPVDLCLYLADELLTCWPSQQRGQWRASLQWPEQAMLSLRSAEHIVAYETLKTVSRQPKRRRRLVAPWSVF